MMQAGELPLAARQAVARIGRSLQPRRILVFGSYASGRPRVNSDVDLLVIVADDREMEAQLQHCRQLVVGSFPRIDPVVCSVAELQGGGARALFLASALAAGHCVYGY